ncbi:NmrA family protein [Paenibacillus mucilaginosus 3016]|uniref:NmrA family protein n=1 Tax=Paenibacillus mucilaginosus 3016 TaxID=1116391 RepID=H6NLF2_9BACL|nr:SDR family oxidoreductase [Paenibacillus mucilaginosus]AFC30334.1 NmrA family protein [Paenibacillus mucilaginosus 3016]WFA18969.1 SDR family oxidoreductase [Paenibacillus mucilaginosus]
MSILVTGATGALGSLVIQHLLRTVPGDQITAVVRHVEKASSLTALGVEVRHGDYADPASLEKAFAGADKLLFISSPDTDDTLRIVQHANVVKAARDAGVGHLFYTSFAYAEESVIPLRHVHLATEHMIRTTNLPYTFLRNSLYTEVFVNPGLAASLPHGALVTNTGSGRLNTAFRSDLAAAAAAVLTGEGHENKTYNLVSDTAWSYDELASLIAGITGKPFVHQAVSYEEQANMLRSAGLPEPVVQLVAGINQAVAEGETSRTSGDLRNLIGELTPLRTAVEDILKGSV